METHEISELVKESTERIFQSMVFIDVDGEIATSDLNIPGQHMTAMVGITGAWVGLASIHCSEPFAKRISAAMMGIEQDILSSEDVRDALGEVANMIAGDVKAKISETLPQNEQIFEQSVPSVICGQDCQTHTAIDAPRYGVHFRVDGESFTVELALRKA